MPSRSTLTAVVTAVLVMIAILDLVRRRKLHEEFSVLWLVTGLLMVVIAAWYDPLVFLTRLIGLEDPNDTLFFFALVFLLLLNVFYSVKISLLSDQVRTLAQKLAMAELQEEPDEDAEPTRNVKPSDTGCP